MTNSNSTSALTTHITFVLDSSGSMSSIKADTIGGFNEFLADQQDEPGEARVSLERAGLSHERSSGDFFE